MANIAISVFDSKYFHYGVRLFHSLRAFNPDLELFAGDLGLLPSQRSFLEALGVRVLQSDRAKILRERGMSLTFSDYLLNSYLQEVEWDRLVAMDADTLFTGEISELFSYDVEVVGHPGRSAKGPIYKFSEIGKFAVPGTMEWIKQNLTFVAGGAYFASGVWSTRSRKFLEFLNALVDRLPPEIRNASPIFTGSIHHLGLSHHQLDPDIWNFGRELIYQARFEDGQIKYQDICPKVIAFSFTSEGKKPANEEVDKFFDAVVRPGCRKKPLDRLIHFLKEQEYTKLAPGKLEMLDRLTTEVTARAIPGDLVECGTWRGGSAAVIFNAASESPKNIHLFDTFEGMPAPSAQDFKQGEEAPGSLRSEGGTFGKGSLADTSVAQVSNLFDQLGYDLGRLKINKACLGEPPLIRRLAKTFCQTAARMVGLKVRDGEILAKFPETISLLHVDVDFYEPYKWILGNLYQRVSHGGVIVFDDYGHWIGAKRAVEEFLQLSGESLLETPGTSQRFIRKRQKVYVDLDDFCEEYMDQEIWGLLKEVKLKYPDFKVTMFTIPGKSSPQWLRWVRKDFPWLEMAIHGTYHEDREEWLVSGNPLEELLAKIQRIFNDEIYAKGFKAPWWKLSRAGYSALRRAGFWVATNKTNKFVKPLDPLNYTYDSGMEILPDIHYRQAYFDTWHGHVQSQRHCNPHMPNGVGDVFDLLCRAWDPGAKFGFISELFR